MENEIEVYQDQAVDVLKQAEAIEVVDKDSYDAAFDNPNNGTEALSYVKDLRRELRI